MCLCFLIVIVKGVQCLFDRLAISKRNTDVSVYVVKQLLFLQYTWQVQLQYTWQVQFAINTHVSFAFILNCIKRVFPHTRYVWCLYSYCFVLASKIVAILISLTFNNNNNDNNNCPSEVIHKWRWIGALRHFSSVFGYIWWSVSTAEGTHCSWEWTSNLPLATDNYLSWDSDPSVEGRSLSIQYAIVSLLFGQKMDQPVVV